MKITQNRHQNQYRKNSLTKFIQNKQNQPFNTPMQVKKLGSKAQNMKIGQQIKHKIQRMYQKGVRKEEVDALKERRQQNFKTANQYSPQLSLTKSVSFEERFQSPGLSRHNSKKSILKNSLSKMNSSLSLKQSQLSLANSHIGSQDPSTENVSGNKILKDKYYKILAGLQQQKKRYTDEVYPPVKSSIYLNNSLMKNFCEMFEKEGRSVEWMRLSELFAHKQLTLWTTQKDKKSYILNGPMSKTSDYLPSAFNLISSKKTVLQKMFQGQQINKQGIYYVKIHQTQQNIWKYVIIDDYIPVIINKKIALPERYLCENVYPAFLNVQTYSNTLQIWPFLLQKAYAKYYSTYDSLANGFVYDFIQELTGVFLQQHKVKEHLDKINKLIKNEDTLLLGEDKKGVFFPIKNKNYQEKDNAYTYLDKDNNFIEKTLRFEQFVAKFHSIHFAHLHKYYYVSKCQIQQQHVKNSKEHEGYILRNISIDDSCDCQLTVIQKQQRFYRSLLSYEYVWIRLILVQQETIGYRWIASSYSNHKTVKLSTALNPGRYVLIIMPQWGSKKYDLNLMYSGTTQASFQRQPYELHKNIIEDSCMDLAQRFGKLAQISKNICSYHYIEKNIGFVIENINNQKESGNVRILRSIEGLQKFNIKPINPQFRVDATIQVVIPCSKSYTVVLMTSKGVQQQILDMFDFGS